MEVAVTCRGFCSYGLFDLKKKEMHESSQNYYSFSYTTGENKMSWDSDTDHRADGKKMYKKNKYGNKKPKREINIIIVTNTVNINSTECFSILLLN